MALIHAQNSMKLLVKKEYNSMTFLQLEFDDGQYDYDYQWFECNDVIELMVPKYLKDFLAEAVDLLIDRNFDIREV